jgi:hypothetical protein
LETVLSSYEPQANNKGIIAVLAWTCDADAVNMIFYVVHERAPYDALPEVPSCSRYGCTSIIPCEPRRDNSRVGRGFHGEPEQRALRLA